MPDHVLISRLRAGGIATPRVAVDEARRAGLPLPFACALLEKESAGGHNVFGHDASIFSGAGAVTREKYLAYKRLRGRTKMQGVGPVQLTWWELQDAADREGGCWRPEINMRVGFRHLAELIREHGESDGARRYNGSGDAAAAYSADLLTRARRWERILADVPAAASNGNGRHGAGRHAAEGHAHRGTDAHGHQSVSRAGGGDGHYGAGRRASDGPDGYRRASDRTTTDRSGRERRATDRPGGHAAQPPRDRAADLPGAAGGRAGAGGRLRQDVRSSTVQRGDHGDVVRRLTNCLTFLEYLDGARERFDGETERALTAFQRDHRLEVDGVLGPESAEALARAVQRVNEDHVDGRAAKVERTDERSDVALDELIAYGAQLRARLDAARARTGSAELTTELISEIGSTLLRIESRVAALAPGAESVPATASAESPAKPRRRRPASAAATSGDQDALHSTVALTGAVAEHVGAAAVQATVSQLPPAGESDDALAARLELLDADMDATVRVLVDRFEGYERELAELEPPMPRGRPAGGRFVRDPDGAAGPGARPARPGGGADRRAGGHRGHKPAPRKKPERAPKPKHLGERAYRVAAGLVGVMEVGGNNAGAKVTEIIRANGGTGPEPWCGDFVAYCYRLSGSKAVTRNWAAVRLLRGAGGVTGTRKPRRGDLVRYSFDHVGMFVRDRGDGTIETIEGNTGASGAVSDSRTGGDGVYRKIRSKSLVKDYLRVHR